MIGPMLASATQGALIGVLATIGMDLGALLGRRVGITRGAGPDWLGRWFAYLVRGRFVHRDIRTTPPLPDEMRWFLSCHYTIGAGLGIVYASMCAWLELPVQSLATATAFGLATNVLPWFVMFPAWGFGIAGLRGPPDTRLFRSSLWNHLMFGLALGGSARLPVVPT